MNPIEFRSWPQTAIPLAPNESPIFRLPLPPTKAIVRAALPGFVLALLSGFGMVFLERVYFVMPEVVTTLLGAGVAINVAAALVRTVWPQVNFFASAQVGSVILGIGAMLWFGHFYLTAGPATMFSMGLLPFVIFGVLMFALSASPHLAFGKTNFHSLRWAAVFLVPLVGVSLHRYTSVQALWRILPLVVIANIAVAWCIVSNYAKYYLANPDLAPDQVTRGEHAVRARCRFLSLEMDAPTKAIAVLAFALTWPLVCHQLVQDASPEVSLEVVELHTLRVSAEIYFLLATIFPIFLFLFFRRSAAMAAEAHLVWFGYCTAGPVAAASTFRFPGVLCSVATRRAVYTGLLVLNVMTLRVVFAAYDVHLTSLTFSIATLYLPTFVTPLLGPFGLSAFLYCGVFRRLQRATHEQGNKND